MDSYKQTKAFDLHNIKIEKLSTEHTGWSSNLDQVVSSVEISLFSKSLLSHCLTLSIGFNEKINNLLDATTLVMSSFETVQYKISNCTIPAGKVLKFHIITANYPCELEIGIASTGLFTKKMCHCELRTIMLRGCICGGE